MVRVQAVPGAHRAESWVEPRQYSRGNPQNSQIMPRLPLLLAMVPVLSAPGCCSLARLFCGPDRSEWVQVDYQTPAAALRTFLEALRRDNVARVCESLSETYKRDKGIDTLNAQQGWEQLREQNPYLYMAGYAKVPDRPTWQDGNRATFDLEIEGYDLHVGLVRQSYWLVHYLWPDGTVQEKSMLVPSLAPALQLQEPDDDGYVRIRFLNPAGADGPEYRLHSKFDGPGLEQVVGVEFGQEWKISELSIPRPD